MSKRAGNNKVNPAILDPAAFEFADKGAPVIVGTSDKWAANVEWGGNNGAVIILNSQLFPDDAAKKFNVFGGAQSAVDLFNHTYDVNLTGVQVEEAVILHELWHIAGGTPDSVIDSDAQKKALITNAYTKEPV